jgi:RNA polymerase sigma-70 factor (ECF subfamily)
MMQEHVHDTVLIEKLRSGSRGALQELYCRYGRLVHRTALRITDSPEDAEDVLQDLFVGLPEAIASFEGRGSFEGWIRRVAARMALMRIRRASRRREVPIEALAVAGREPGTISDGGTRVDCVNLERALTQLSELQRAVFVLKEIEGYSHAEIGATLGISGAASTVRLHRAKKELMRLLGRQQ